MKLTACIRIVESFSLLGILVLAGCEVPGESFGPISVSETKAEQYPAAFQRDERGRKMSEHARALAVALTDSVFRGRLYELIHYSRLPEHKLYWNAASLELEVQFADALSRSSQLVPSNASVFPVASEPYELYLPVRSHRAAWKGGRELIVALQMHQDGPIIGYSPDGTWQELDSETPPQQPVLALVPTELRTEDRIAPSGVNKRYASIKDTASQSSCEPGDPPEWCVVAPAIQPLVSPPVGVYVTATHVKNKAEPWIRGDPEIEFVLLGTVTGRYFADPYFNLQPNLGFDSGEFLQPIACSGRLAPFDPEGLKRFDFNAEGRIYTQQVLLEQQSEFKIVEQPAGQNHTILWRRQASFHAPFIVQAWERDDGGECPTPASAWMPSVRVGFGFQTYPIFRLQSVVAQGSLSGILSYLGITNQNDYMGGWVFSTWDTFEALDGSIWYNGSHVNVAISNTGVNRYNVPPTIDPF